MKLCNVQLKLSTTRHPQTDGSSEVMNRLVENYLRSYCSYPQDDWENLLLSAEFAHNSAVTEDLGVSPFELVIGWNPHSTLDFLSGHRPVHGESVDEVMTNLQGSLRPVFFENGLGQAVRAVLFMIRPPDIQSW